MKIDINTTEQKYDILLSDPPWQQGRGGKKASRPKSTGISVPYQTMSLPEILEVHHKVTANLMNENHNVFLWTIDKFLPDAEKMMDMLGYQLHARMIWDKINGPAAAYTLRFSHEYLLWFFKKGHILMPEKDCRGAFTTVMREASRKHSQKPICAYERIETMFTSANKLELFARETRVGWDCWGNEV